MPDTQTVDEVVSNRTSGSGGGLSRRPVEEETVSVSGGPAKVVRSGIEDETHEGGRRGRVFPKSTEELLAKMEKGEADARTPAPHEEGDADEDGEGDHEAGDEDSSAGDDGSGEDMAAAGADESAGEGDAGEEGEGEEDAAPDPTAEFRAANETLSKRNRELLSELETARKTPKSQRTERETALVAAETAYIEEGSVASIRKFLSVVTGAAPDSKEVDHELAGLYTDLTARELGVPLDENQRTLRDNARTRLLLARDKREKVEAEKKPAADNSADDVQYGEAAKFVDNLLTTKGQTGTSLADEYPLLMNLAEDFDGYAPSEVLARAIRQEIMTGTLDPNGKQDIELVRAVAPKIEAHYDGLAKRIEAARAKQRKPGTTPSAKPKAAIDTSKQTRPSPARTITNAAASRAPAKAPKTTTQKAKTTTGEKTRKDFPSEAAWKDYLFSKHFKS